MFEMSKAIYEQEEMLKSPSQSPVDTPVSSCTASRANRDASERKEEERRSTTISYYIYLI